MTTIDALRREAIDALAAGGVPAPEVDADLLIGHVLGLSRGGVQARALISSAVADDAAAAIRAAVTRRAAREPLQHITGLAPFRSLELEVGPGVFTPRPETEFVVQFAIDALALVPSPDPLAVDLGSGSGAIALAMATEVPHSRVVAVEKSADALPWTARNIERHGDGRVRLVEGDLADALPELDGLVDVVASNPPYIPLGAVPRDPEVRLFDPAAALYSGEDGLDAVRALSRTARRLLRPGGALVIEHGELQAADIGAILRADGFSAIACHRDLLGRDRATTARR
ncbi:peptide chain release factor N(5)-glutamine methyltransferase [Yonghaparkia sp. Soil809]|uniref:peptide chain release factor N(5)-glutamine methyltransferase n=1 Tax=Yonghaparkia sp. Soil809 TaxID=1736417 RepID=UPI000700F0F9|nr:peptide chain release factor N(5)-glutamine methyltransferase [Yonghaparkia sp. Soil809]KRF31024.1 protein-(glutamine-N5) methyltransferase, release factor-specific [Yonghaparkia sp. Soil809]